MEVGRGEDDAVGGDFVAWLHHDDVADDEVPDRDGLPGALFASEHGDILLAVQALKLDKFVVLAVVVPGSDEDLEYEGDEDEDTFDPASGWLDDHAWNDADDGKDTNQNDDAVIQLILQRIKEGRSLNTRLHVLAVLDLSSLEVLDVTHDSGISFGL